MYFMNHVKSIICKSLYEIHIFVCVHMCYVYKCTVKNVFACHCSPAASEIVMDIILAALKYQPTTW